MSANKRWLGYWLVYALAWACTGWTEEGSNTVVGMLLVGPWNDHGWSQAHYDAGKYVEQKIPGTKLLYLDKVNPADRPGTTAKQLAENLLQRGARIIIFNSDDMKDNAIAFAKAHPGVKVIHATGDSAWSAGRAYEPVPNIANVMGRMEYGQMIAGAAAALSTKSGKIGYVGPLINDETRRLTVAAYLGARHVWTQYLGRDPKDLVFKVVWIGFWFNIPGVTSDPTQVTEDLLDTGCDVIISQLDTTEHLVQTKKVRRAGKEVYAVAYDYKEACAEAAEVCLGSAYFNWGPDYVRMIQEILAGHWQPAFIWSAPDWRDINNPDTSAVGFAKGPAMQASVAALVDKFTAELAAGLNLWQGPLNYQDGRRFLNAGEAATDQQVWYLPQLLQGMEGQSVAK